MSRNVCKKVRNINNFQLESGNKNNRVILLSDNEKFNNLFEKSL